VIDTSLGSSSKGRKCDDLSASISNYSDDLDQDFKTASYRE
jgi:hypothetical protein